MKVHEAIKWLSKLPADSDVIINWWDLDDLIAAGGRADLTYDEWKHLVNHINGTSDWNYIFDLAIEESHDVVARREDLFKGYNIVQNADIIPELEKQLLQDKSG